MKKLILLLAAVALATSVWAQDTPKKPSFAGFVSNGFWDNWEITLGGGAGTALSNGTNQGSFGDRINFEANFGLTKWFHPVTGMRLQLQGGQFANFDDVLGKAKWPYLFVHADFMLNFSNWAGGYREDRAYYAVPFAGFGYMASNFTDKSHENNGSGTHQSFAFTLGWLNKFRISPSFDFNIELKGLIAPSRVSPVAMDGSYLFGFSATAGFTYRFNKRGWQRGVAGYTVADIQAFQDAVAASMAAAAPGKPRVAGGIDRTAAIRPCNDGVRPLQHHHSIPCFRIAQRRAFPVRVDLCRRVSGQPGHLAGVGR